MAENKPVDPTLLANPFSYHNLVQYQDSSIVSRTIIDKSEGTITIFAFDKGQRLSTHSAPFDALVNVVDGSAVITIEETTFAVKEGHQIVMPANKPHAVYADDRFKMVLTMIRSVKKD